jgi:hypothetical protein
MLPGDVKLLGGEQFFPLFIAFHGARGGVGSHVVQPRSNELLTAFIWGIEDDQQVRCC